jgi:hypothetical protein
MIGGGDSRFAEAGDLLVTGGEILLDGETAEEIIAGLPYLSRFESLPLTGSTAMGQKLRVSEVAVACEGVRVKAGTVGGGPPDIFQSRLLTDTTALTPQELLENLTIASDHEGDPRIYIEVDDGFDMVLKSYEVRFAK